MLNEKGTLVKPGCAVSGTPDKPGFGVWRGLLNRNASSLCVLRYRRMYPLFSEDVLRTGIFVQPPQNALSLLYVRARTHGGTRARAHTPARTRFLFLRFKN